MDNFTKAIIFYILILSLFSNCLGSSKINSNTQDVSNFQSEILNILKFDSTFINSHSGLVVKDISSSNYIINHKGSQYFTPASNTKLLTFYTALNVLDQFAVGLKYMEKKDSIIIWGTGDPSFLNPKLETNKNVIDFLMESNKPIYFSSSNFQDVRYGSGWSWDDYNYGYQTEKNSLPMFGNMVKFEKKEGNDQLRITPSYFQLLSEPNMETQPSTIMREEVVNLFRYDKYRIDAINNLDRNIPFVATDELIRDLLSEVSGKRIQLTNSRSEIKKAKEISTIHLDSLYKLMLHPSDNFVAEQLLLNCGSELFDTLNTRKVIEWAKKELLSGMPHDFQWYDGSGLSRYNMTTPENMAYLLFLIYKKVPKKRLFELLPAGGESGTIKNWYASDPPFIYAKTGSLKNNHSLSGYLIGDTGKIYAFSFMNSNYLVSNTELKQGMDKILRILKSNL